MVIDVVRLCHFRAGFRGRCCEPARTRGGLLAGVLGACLVLGCSSPAWAQGMPTGDVGERGAVAADAGQGGAIPPTLLRSIPVQVPVDDVPAGGEVLLVLTLDRTGRVSQVVFETLVTPRLAQVVRRALADFVFAPAQVKGAPVSAKVRFRMDVETQEPPPVRQRGPSSVVAPAGGPVVTDEEDGAAAAFGAQARIVRRKPGAATQVKLRGAELSHIPGTFGEPLRVVATLPGVARSPFGFGFYVVRGASFENTGFFLDGFAVPILYHLGAGPAVLPSRLVDQLDFYPGGYPVEFGRYTAGVISLSTKAPRVEGPQLEFELDFLRASALAVLPFAGGKGQLAIGARRSYYELIVPLFTDAVTLSYLDYQLRLDYAFSSRFRASVFVFGSRDQLDIELSTGAGDTAGSSASGVKYAFDQALVSLEWKPSERLGLKWSAIFGPTDLALGSASTGSSAFGLDMVGLRLGQRLALHLGLADGWSTTVGVHYNVYRYEPQGDVPSLREFPGVPSAGNDPAVLTVEDRLWELAAAPYLESVFRFAPLEWTVGLRLEYLRYALVESWSLDPRTVLRLHLAQPLVLKLSTGLFTQPPLPYQISVDVANPELKPNRSWQSTVGLEWELPAAFEVDTSVFYNRMWQLTRGSSQPVLADDGSIAQNFFDDDGQGQAYGLEVLLRRQLEQGLFGWVSYTLSRSERFLSGGAHQVFFYDQTHVLNFALSYVLGKFRFGARFTMATGRPVTDLYDPAGERTVFDVDDQSYETNAQPYGVRLPTFHQLDLRVDRNFSWGPLEGSVYLDVLNVYNAPNSEGYQYSFDHTQRGRLPGFPLLPTLGVRGVLR